MSYAENFTKSAKRYMLFIGISNQPTCQIRAIAKSWAQLFKANDIVS